jgi:hypothetical protein
LPETKIKTSRSFHSKNIKPHKAFIVTATNDAFPLDEQSQVIGLTALMELVDNKLEPHPYTGTIEAIVP